MQLIFLSLNSSKLSQMPLSMRMSHRVRLEVLGIEFKILIIGIKYRGNLCMNCSGDELKQLRVIPKKKEKFGFMFAAISV